MSYCPINNCKYCDVNDKCICHECINFYASNLFYKDTGCIDSVIRSGCFNYNKGREKDGCLKYTHIGWTDKIRHSKTIEAGRKKLKDLMGWKQ